MLRMQTWLTRGRLRLDAWRFSEGRADYFDYLQAVLRGAQGRLTMRELFDRDAARHGAGTVRGRLSRTWARACEASGGDLHATWLGCFPADELALVRAAQVYGNARLLACFQALSSHLALLIQARRMLWAMLGSAAGALLVASLLLLALPQWTVPALRQAFQGLPAAYLGAWSQALFASADWLRAWGLWLPTGIVVLLAGGLYALPRWHGPLRDRLDRFGPWRLYRQVQALRLLALVSILLQPGAGGSTQLRPVILLFLEDAGPWLGAHLGSLAHRIDQGLAGAAAFDTGLLDRDLYWYLEDMVDARGLQAGLQAVHQRMAGRWLDRVRHQALVLRWTALLLGVAVVLSIGLWHYAALDELRRGWMIFHAGA
ncbi:MAG: hypothetical protein ACK5JE_09490 [Castellaniella sp.]|uniref:hypothetical protein n=1 Tax=Castellaniella sp. TaxID=1955812 RepID=UPI003A87D424